MKKILIIRFNPLTDFIHCIPAFSAIRKRHSEDEITILTEKSLIKICKRSGYFDKVWLDNKPAWVQIMGVIDIIKRLKGGRFDMVYDLQNDDRSLWYYKLIGPRKPNWNSSIAECSHQYSPQAIAMHYQDLIHNQLEVAGIKETPHINISYIASKEAEELPENFAMICCGGDREKKPNKWHPQKYAEVMDYLHEKHGITSVIVGDGGDDMLINSLTASNCIKAKPINYSGKTTVAGIIAVAKKARFCLGNETDKPT